MKILIVFNRDPCDGTDVTRNGLQLRSGFVPDAQGHSTQGAFP